MSSKPGNVFFVRGDEMGSEEEWDDEELINFYDKVFDVSKKKVAERYGSEINSDSNLGERSSEFHIKLSKSNNMDKKKNKQYRNTGKKLIPQMSDLWEVDTPCRAIFTEDGLEYEAFVKLIIDDENCVVKYFGYNNEEVKPFSDLRPSLGKDAIQRQIWKSQGSVSTNQSEDEEQVNVFEDIRNRRECSANVKNNHYENNSMKRNTKKRGNSLPTFNFPPFDPCFGMNSDPPPPPHMPFLPGDFSSDDKTLYPMLVSWYMSGYYTGLHQGQKMAEKKARNSRY